MDEVYIVAGHKGHPQSVAAKERRGRRSRLKGARGRGTAAKDKPPVLGILERGGEVLIRMLDNVQQKTIKPIIESYVCQGSLVYSDEHRIYNRLDAWGYTHKQVCHGVGEYARDDDEDAFVRFMSIPLRAFGHYSGHGYDLTKNSLKKTYPYTSASSSLFMTSALVGAPYCLLYYKLFCALETHIEPKSIVTARFPFTGPPAKVT